MQRGRSASVRRARSMEKYQPRLVMLHMYIYIPRARTGRLYGAESRFPPAARAEYFHLVWGWCARLYAARRACLNLSEAAPYCVTARGWTTVVVVSLLSVVIGNYNACGVKGTNGGIQVWFRECELGRWYQDRIIEWWWWSTLIATLFEVAKSAMSIVLR